MPHQFCRSLTPALLLTLGASACISTKAPERTGLMTQAPNVLESSQQVFLRKNEFTTLFVGAVERRADIIRNASDDPEIDRAALIWKMNATSAMLRATSYNDPLMSLMDAWVLCFQMQDFFTHGFGVDLFGQYTTEAIELSELAILEIETVAAALATPEGVRSGRQQVRTFAANNPIESELFLRRSVVSEIVAQLPRETRDAFASVGAVTETLENLSARLALYADHLPRQARWQAELVLEHPRYYELIGNAGEAALAVRETLEGIGEIVADSPALDEGFTMAVEGVVSALEQAVIELDAIVEAQRQAVEGILDNKQLEIAAFVQSERMAILGELDRSLAETLDRIDALATRTVNDTGILSEATVDHVFWRGLQLLGVAFLAAVVLILISRFLPPRRKTT